MEKSDDNLSRRQERETEYVLDAVRDPLLTRSLFFRFIRRLRAHDNYTDDEFQYCRGYFRKEWNDITFQPRPLSEAGKRNRFFLKMRRDG